jgi:hypothetical protein
MIEKLCSGLRSTYCVSFVDGTVSMKLMQLLLTFCPTLFSGMEPSKSLAHSHARPGKAHCTRMICRFGAFGCCLPFEQLCCISKAELVLTDL